MIPPDIAEPTSVSDRRRKLLAQLLRDRARLSQTEHEPSPAQRGVWFMQQLEPANFAYNLPFCVNVTTEIASESIKSAAQHLIDRHPMLRATFPRKADQVVMVVHGARDVELEEIDASDWNDDELQRQVERRFQQPFDLENGPLLRCLLFSRSATDHVLLFVFHHLICDGWSLGIIVQEFMHCYQAALAGRRPGLPPLTVNYSDYARQTQEWLNSTQGAQSKAFWLDSLSGDLPRLALPSRPVREAFDQDAREIYHFEVDDSLYLTLIRLAQSWNTTLSSVALTAYQTLLMRFSGQQEVLVGMPMAGRSQSEYEQLVGHFVNLVAIRSDLSDAPTFRDFVERTWRTVQRAVEHQEYPFLDLIKNLGSVDRSERMPLFRTAFNFLRLVPDHPLACSMVSQASSLPWGPLQIRNFAVSEQEEPYDISIRVTEIAPRLHIRLQYDSRLFDLAFIERFAGAFVELLRSAAADPSRRVDQLALISSTEQTQILQTWNRTAAEYPRDRLTHELLADQAKRTPHSTALVVRDSRLSYQELDERTNRLARYLQQQGIGRGDLVAVCTDRSVELIVALIGTLKAGAAYVPVDPRYPADRVRLMLEDSRARFALTTEGSEALIRAIADTPRLCLDRDWSTLATLSSDTLPTNSDPLDLAYVIYTSGSTGQPKGVQIPHRALVNFLWSMRERPGITADDVMLSVTTLSFDIFGLELFLPLIVGARLELASADEVVNGALLAHRLAACGATVMQATPVTWRMLLASGFHRSQPFKALCGGEALPADLADQLLTSGVDLWNMYGPTETTIWSCVEQVTQVDGCISIGRPIANTQAYVLDGHLQPVPTGVAGRLYLGGDGLARGYLGRPQLTAEKFVETEVANVGKTRLYDTGDLARFLPDGRLECLGRTDHQIKLRGYRIELEDIEAAIRQHEGIAHAVVALRDDRSGHPHLVGYYVPDSNGSKFTSAVLRAWLAGRLPEYMIPAVMISLPKLPLTPNGKVDRRALPAPQMALAASAPDALGPLNDTERMLMEIWKNLLGVESVTPTDNFFALGGHSFLAMQLSAELERLYRRPLPVTLLFQAPTIRDLAHEVENFPPIYPGPHVFSFRGEGEKPPLFLMPSLVGGVLQWRSIVSQFDDDDRPVCGVYIASEPDYHQESSLEQFALDCAKAIIQAYPDRPCHLCGYSFGGTLAFEVARQLKLLGHEVGTVAILDWPPPSLRKHNFAQLARRAPQIVTHLAARVWRNLANGKWQQAKRTVVNKSKLILRNVAAKSLKSQRTGDDVAVEYTFGKITLPDRARRIMKWCMELQDSYQPSRYPGRVLVLRASRRPVLGPFERDLGWGLYADKGVVVADLPGSHAQMVDDEQVRKIVDVLNRSFTEFENAPQAALSAV